MKVVLVFVSTLNGLITHGDDPEVRHWSSRSDQEYYTRVWRNSRLVVMGSNTFSQNRIGPSPSRLIVVMTGHPGRYQNQVVPGMIEFTSESPTELTTRFTNMGYDMMTVVGGSRIATSFLREKLVDELWLTIEPRIFGSGTPLIAEADIEVELELMELEQVNKKGTLITKYRIIKNPDLS